MRVAQNCSCFSREVDGPCQGCSRSRSFVPPETVKPLPSPRMEFLLCGFSDVLGDLTKLLARMSAEGCSRGSDLTAIPTAALYPGPGSPHLCPTLVSAGMKSFVINILSPGCWGQLLPSQAPGAELAFQSPARNPPLSQQLCSGGHQASLPREASGHALEAAAAAKVPLVSQALPGTGPTTALCSCARALPCVEAGLALFLL